jgi:hypothetical protein
MKKLTFIVSFLLCAFVSKAQFPNNQSISNTSTIYHIKGAAKGDLSLMFPIVDTLNNPATVYPGAMTIRPQDTIGHAVFPVYQSNGVYWTKVASNILISTGVDSVTIYFNQLCQWIAGTPTCYFLQSSTFGANDSFHLNFDSTWILHWSNGNLLSDSIFLIHTNLTTDNHLNLSPGLGPYDRFLEATWLLDSVYASPFGSGFNYYRYANGVIDSLAAGSGGGSSGLDSTYISADSLYQIFIYASGRIDSVQWTGGGSSGVQSVTGLNTDNTDPLNPIVNISVDGTTITGSGTSGDPLVAVSQNTFYNADGTLTGGAFSGFRIVGLNGKDLYFNGTSASSVQIGDGGFFSANLPGNYPFFGMDGVGANRLAYMGDITNIYDTTYLTVNDVNNTILLSADTIKLGEEFGLGRHNGTAAYSLGVTSTGKIVTTTLISGGTTSEQPLTATGGQTAFTFTSLPASYNDYIIFINSLVAESTTDYTASGNIVTLVVPRVAGDRILMRRIK